MFIMSVGFVKLIDHMGTDKSVVDSARVSYNGKGKSSDERLINFLMKNKHMTPFEMICVKVHVKCPLFVARQWMRHRTFSYNEISARYTEMEESFYMPEYIRENKSKNKQVSTKKDLCGCDEEQMLRFMKENNEHAYSSYKRLLDQGVAREMARGLLNMNYYTEFYCLGNVRNWLNFITLRDAKDAQLEIQEYAKEVANIIKELYPLTFQAYESLRASEALVKDILNDEELFKLITHEYKVRNNSRTNGDTCNKR